MLRPLKLGSKMKLYVFKALLGHLQHIGGVGQKNIPAMLVLGHKLHLALFEILQLGLIGRANPTSLVKVNGFVATGGSVFVQQSVFNNLKLQLAHRANDLATIKLIGKQLGRPRPSTGRCLWPAASTSWGRHFRCSGTARAKSWVSP